MSSNLIGLGFLRARMGQFPEQRCGGQQKSNQESGRIEQKGQSCQQIDDDGSTDFFTGVSGQVVCYLMTQNRRQIVFVVHVPEQSGQYKDMIPRQNKGIGLVGSYGGKWYCWAKSCDAVAMREPTRWTVCAAR